VDIVYKTLNRLKTYLSDFWLFYQSSPSLQKALANAWFRGHQEPQQGYWISYNQLFW